MFMPTTESERAAAPVLGDWVRVLPWGHIGRVYQVHDRCPESAEWLAMQACPVPKALADKRWCSVLVAGGGAVAAPISRCERVNEHPETLVHPFARMYFRQEVE